MRAIKLLLFIMTILMASLFAEPLSWSKSYDEAKKTAAKENKIVMIVLTQDGCNMCDYLKYVVFKNTDVIAETNARFVLLEVDIHKDKIPSGMRAYGTPTIYFTDQNGNKIGRQMVGAAKPDAFLEALRGVKKP